MRYRGLRDAQTQVPRRRLHETHSSSLTGIIKENQIRHKRGWSETGNNSQMCLKRNESRRWEKALKERAQLFSGRATGQISKPWQGEPLRPSCIHWHKHVGCEMFQIRMHTCTSIHAHTCHYLPRHVLYTTYGGATYNRTDLYHLSFSNKPAIIV